MLGATLSLPAQKEATITVQADKGTDIIPKEIYGQFAEHLGSCIYGGIWVGENSDIPNIKGYRTDVFNALPWKTTPSVRMSSSTSARCSAASLTSAETSAAEPSRNLPNGWNT